MKLEMPGTLPTGPFASSTSSYLALATKLEPRIARMAKAPPTTQISTSSMHLGESLAVSSQDDFSVDSFGFADMSDLSVPGTFDDSLLMPNFYIPSARAFYTFGQYQFDLAIDSSQ
jgi:hypothetical protein